MDDLIDLAQTRLKGAVPAFANEVWGIVELEEAKGQPPSRLHTPSSYVILLGENALADQLMGTDIVEQKVTATFGIVLAIENTRNPLGIMGGGNQDRLKEIRKAVRDAVLGYTFDPTYFPAEFVRGRLIRVENGVLWWQDDFRCDYFIRS